MRDVLARIERVTSPVGLGDRPAADQRFGIGLADERVAVLHRHVMGKHAGGSRNRKARVAPSHLFEEDVKHMRKLLGRQRPDGRHVEAKAIESFTELPEARALVDNLLGCEPIELLADRAHHLFGKAVQGDLQLGRNPRQRRLGAHLAEDDMRIGVPALERQRAAFRLGRRVRHNLLIHDFLHWADRLTRLWLCLVDIKRLPIWKWNVVMCHLFDFNRHSN